MAPLNVKPAKDKLRNSVYARLSDSELEELDKLFPALGYDSRGSFVRACVISVIHEHFKDG